MLIEAIRNGSVSTWAHVNLHGEFNFSDERMVDSKRLTPPQNRTWNWAKIGRLKIGLKPYWRRIYAKSYADLLTFGQTHPI